MTSNLSQRIVTGIIAGSIALAALLYHPNSFAFLMLLIVTIAAREWAKLGGSIYADSTCKRWGFNAAFVVYMAPCAYALWWLRSAEENGVKLALTCLVCVWIIDIAAYAFGRAIGGPKIAPSISPSKTWAGLLGAVLCLIITGFYLYDNNPYMAALLGLMAIIAQTGDFFESWLKRKAGVKDSGTILPGHGGMLDRIDGLVFAAPYFALLQMTGSI